MALPLPVLEIESSTALVCPPEWSTELFSELQLSGPPAPCEPTRPSFGNVTCAQVASQHNLLQESQVFFIPDLAQVVHFSARMLRSGHCIRRCTGELRDIVPWKLMDIALQV